MNRFQVLIALFNKLKVTAANDDNSGPLMTEISKAVIDISDIETQISTLETDKTKLETKNSDLETSRNTAKTNLKSLYETFGIKEGTAAEEAITSIKATKESFDTLSTRAEQFEKYDLLSPDLDGIIKDKKENFDKLHDKYKDNDVVMSLIDYDSEADKDDFSKQSKAFDVLTKMDGEFSKVKNPNQDRFNHNNRNGSLGNKDNNGDNGNNDGGDGNNDGGDGNKGDGSISALKESRFANIEIK